LYYSGSSVDTYIPKKCYEPMSNLGFFVAALNEDPPNFSLARQVYTGKGGGTAGKSIQEYILRDDAALSEYGRAVAERSSPGEIDEYILGLFDEDSDLGVPPGTSAGVLSSARVGALKAAVVHGVSLKLFSEYYDGMMHSVNTFEPVAPEEEVEDARGGSATVDVPDEANQNADLLVCLFAGGGGSHLYHHGVWDGTSTMPGLESFYEMRFSYMCKYFGTCSDGNEVDWEGYLTLLPATMMGTKLTGELQSATASLFEKVWSQLLTVPYQELLHAAGETELALMPAALASKPEAWIPHAMEGQAIMRVLGPLLATVHGGRFKGTATALTDFFHLKGAELKSPRLGAFCLAHRDGLPAFGVNFLFRGEMISANNIICTDAGQMIPASPYYFTHMQGTFDVRYFFVNARQISMSGKLMRNYLWNIWRGGYAPGTPQSIAQWFEMAWREYSLTMEKFAKELFPLSSYHQAAAERFASEGGGAWIDTFMKQALGATRVKDPRACVALVNAGVQDALPAKIVLGLVETSVVTPCSELDDDDDLFKGDGASEYQGPNSDNGLDKRRRSLLQCSTAAQSTLLSKLWDEAAHVYFGSGWQGHHFQPSGFDFTPYARAEEVGRQFGTMEWPASKANAFIMDAFRARTSADNAATIRKHILVTYTQMSIERAHRLDAELAAEEPDEKVWAVTQAEGWTAWRILEPLAAQTNAAVADEITAMFHPSTAGHASNESPPASLAPSRYCFVKAQLPGMLGLSAEDIGELHGAWCLCGGGAAVGECGARPAEAGASAGASAGAEDSGPSAAGPVAGGILGGGAVLVGALAAALLARERRRTGAGAAPAERAGAAASERV